MIVELARRVSSCGWVALCERRRAGFARLSGWQPVGNWVASGANFPASLLPVGVIPTTSRESRRTVCVGKWPLSFAVRMAECIAQCLNLEHEFHHSASKLCILGFEPLK